MQNQFKALVNQLQKTTLFITHDLDEAIRIGHRIAIMKDGIIVQIGRGLWGNPGADMLERAARQQNRAAELLQRARDSTEQTDIDRFTKIAENIKSAAETSIAQAEAEITGKKVFMEVLDLDKDENEVTQSGKEAGDNVLNDEESDIEDA